jgi:O-acetylhomoserine (thiol)-lyase
MSANAYSSYQSILGLATLPLILQKINENVETIVKKLKENNINVNHPSLKNHIDNHLYTSCFKGGCGCIITLDLKTKEMAFKFLDNLQTITITANLGDSRTLGLHMQSTIYQDFNKEEKEFLAISDGLVRLSIGLEDASLIYNDLIQSYDIATK